MTDWLAVTAALTLLKKRESCITPLKRNMERTEKDQQDAIKELEQATSKLIDAVSKRNTNEH